MYIKMKKIECQAQMFILGLFPFGGFWGGGVHSIHRVLMFWEQMWPKLLLRLMWQESLYWIYIVPINIYYKLHYKKYLHSHAEGNWQLDIQFCPKRFILKGIIFGGSFFFQMSNNIFYFKINLYVASGFTYISSITDTLKVESVRHWAAYSREMSSKRLRHYKGGAAFIPWNPSNQ